MKKILSLICIMMFCIGMSSCVSSSYAHRHHNHTPNIYRYEPRPKHYRYRYEPRRNPNLYRYEPRYNPNLYRYEPRPKHHPKPKPHPHQHRPNNPKPDRHKPNRR